MTSETSIVRDERGSTLVTSLAVLFLLTAAGIVLLRIAQNETTNNVVDKRSKQAFYMAETAIEQGRDTLRQYRTSHHSTSVVGELATVAGANHTIDAIDPANLGVTFSASGVPTAITGTSDDQLLVPVTQYGNGWFATVLTNDFAESGGRANATTDSNKRVMLIGIGVGPDRTVEMTEGVADTGPDMPTAPGTITVLGDAPHFDAGSSGSKYYFGDDCRCPQAVDSACVGNYAPGVDTTTFTSLGAMDVVGVTTASALTTVQSDINALNSSKQHAIVTGMYDADGTATTTWGAATVENVTVSNPWYAAYPQFQQCTQMVTMAGQIRDMADRIIGTAGTDTQLTGDLGMNAAGQCTNPRIIYCNGGCTLKAQDGCGVLFVRGDLTLDGNVTWYGAVYVIGTGQLYRKGAGGGNVFGSMIVANTCGDLCNSAATGGFCAGATYDMSGGGNSVTGYCSYYNNLAWASSPVKLKSFRQR